MSIKALVSAAAAGALAFGAGAAYAKSDSLRAMDRAEDAVRHMQRTAIPTQLDVLAEMPDYYAITPAATLDTANSPDYYATVATPAEFYASIAPQTSAALAFGDDTVVDDSFDVALNDDSVFDESAITAPSFEAADASVTVSMPATLEVVSSSPVPDTPQNRALYGQPLSRAGRLTAPVGN